MLYYLYCARIYLVLTIYKVVICLSVCLYARSQIRNILTILSQKIESLPHTLSLKYRSLTRSGIRTFEFVTKALFLWLENSVEPRECSYLDFNLKFIFYAKLGLQGSII